MKRTTVALPEELLETLRAIAAERRVSLAAVIRETLAERAAQYHPNGGPWRMPKSPGMGYSEHTDTARREGQGFHLGPPGGNGQVRPAKEEEVAQQAEDEERPMPKSIGIIDSGTTDTARMSTDWHIFEPPEWRS